MSEPLVSICIPTSEMNGNGTVFLESLLQTIDKQTYENYEIIISDQSVDDKVKNLCEYCKTINDKIKYFRDEKGRGSLAANLNNAMDNASGDYFKLIAQDDLFHDHKAIEIMVGTKADFIACGCKHFKDDVSKLYMPHVPYWHQDTLYGFNKVGAVSVVYFKKTDLRFDTNLVWLVDCEFYHRLSLEYGKPLCISKHTFNIRHWPGSISSSVDWIRLKNEETEYIKKKFENENN